MQQQQGIPGIGNKALEGNIRHFPKHGIWHTIHNVRSFVSIFVSQINSEASPSMIIVSHSNEGNRLGRLWAIQQAVHTPFEGQDIVGADLGNRWTDHRYLQAAFGICMPTTSKV